MHYIDLFFSLALFVTGVLTLCLKRFKTNIWLVSICFLLFPVAIVTYYLPELDPVLMHGTAGEITLLAVIVYPVVKILSLVIVIQYLLRMRKQTGSR
ncbi:MAG: hypothetical protein JXQ30_12440 [Spirochaetes bacterium]|nr:hypothetical protein [Spirochaetota bacterium]